MKLIELTDIYKNILNLIDSGESTEDELKRALNQIEDEIETKAQNIAFVLKEIDSDIEKFKSMEDEFARKRKRLENSKVNLKQYLESNMIATDKKKFKTEFFSFNIQKNTPSLNIVNEDFIPDEYYIFEKKLLKRELLDAIKGGLEVDGVSLKQSESLRIR
nr:MAG TPA: resistance protein [Caudoviricetes sp.]